MLPSVFTTTQGIVVVLTALPVLYLLLPEWLIGRCSAILKLLKLLICVRTHAYKNGNKKYSFADTFESSVDAWGNKTLILSADDGRSVTFAEMDGIANQVAHWAIRANLNSDAEGNTVALLMANCPEYVAFWLGMSKVGCSTALLNTNAKGKTLLHSIEAGLASTTGAAAVRVALEESNIKVLNFNDLNLHSFPSTRPDKSLRKHQMEGDALLFIYTSGTTGLPKASKISHGRYTVSCHPLRVMCNLTENDVLYSPLPMYHSAAGMMGVGSCIYSGACFVTRKRFSVHNFTSDVIRVQATCLQYIGELCRYLVTAPPCASDDRIRKLRCAFGNGLRQDVWSAFKSRYHIDLIVEFYGATEGNTVLLNATGHVGALGWVPRSFDFLYPVCIISVSTEEGMEGEPLRDPNTGKCMLAKPGEVGLVVGAIDPSRSDRRFDGYQDKKASAAKLLKGVFKDGDIYFNTGDLMSRDLSGFFYWADRTGDTFRFKGENVSTTEVEMVLGELQFIEDCAAYGVNVPGCEGKAGMIAIKLSDPEGTDTPSATPMIGNTPSVTPSGRLDWELFIEHTIANMQGPARPRFIRIVESIPMTSTFKRMKAGLLRDSYDPVACKKDPLYVWSAEQNNYIPLNKDVNARILSETFKF
eukprot:GSChrysophyteH1.ASY1.ANO1.1177.1 assembled CDS